MRPWLLTLPLFLLFKFTNTTTPAPSKVDFCALDCYDVFTDTTHPNSACDCSIGRHCSENVPVFLPNQTEQMIILKFHNDIREKVASGKEKRGQNRGGVTDMNALAYDQQLEYVASCWANKCNATHDHCRRTDKFEKVGQNFFIGKDMDCSNIDIFKIALDSWYHEIDSVTTGCIMGYSSCISVGHYLQLVWAKTTHVGCARAEMPGPSCHLFCNYGPSGNVEGDAAYTIGFPGNDCPARDKDYRMLCASKRPNMRADANGLHPYYWWSIVVVVYIFLVYGIMTQILFTITMHITSYFF